MRDGPNPVSVWRAKRAFKNFTGRDATHSQVEKLDSANVAGYRLGEMVGVAYEATRDGKRDQYFHRFKKKARPQLVSRSDGKQLYIAGGDYHVTERGIEDMPELFIVNPSSRRKRRKSGGRARTASGQFKRNPSKRKAAPMASPVRRRKRRVARRRTFARNPVSAMRRNPVRRRRRATRIARRSYRRNPIRLGGKGGINIASMIMPGILVGAGAVGAEMLMGYLPLPPMLTTGPARYITKGVISVAAGALIAKFINKKAGEAFATGGIAIAAHDAIKASITNFMPGAKFGQYMGGYNWDKYGYNTPSLDSFPNGALGYYTPGATLNAMGEYQSPEVFQA